MFFSRTNRLHRASSWCWRLNGSQYVASIVGGNHNNSFIVKLKNIPELPKNRDSFYMVAWQFNSQGKPQPIYGSIDHKQSVNWVCLTKIPKANMPPGNPYHNYIEAKYLPKSCHSGGAARTLVDFYLDDFNP